MKVCVFFAMLMSNSDWPSSGKEGVEIDQRGDQLGDPVGDAGDHHAAIGMAGQHDIAQAFVMKDIQNVGDVGREIDRAGQQVRTLALPGQRRREDPVAHARNASATRA